MTRVVLVGFAVAAAGCGGSPPTPPTADADLPRIARAATPDPRLTADTPLRNVRPEVRYVGDAGCVACHPDLTASYHQHPMGRSAAVPKDGTGPEQYGPAFKLPVEVPGYRLDVARTPGRVEHVVTATAPGTAGVPAYRTAADVAIGSGTRGRSYLTCDAGAVWQSPLSWYAEGAGRWDVSPGFDLGRTARRAITAECLFCHVNRVEPVPGTVNQFVEPLLRGQPAVGCERCHGPGQLHVAERANGPVTGVDHTIVNPKHLSPELRDDVCRQCHVLGEVRLTVDGRSPFDFRPGLPLDDFVRVFVRPPSAAGDGKSVGQFEQVEQSRCHAGSGGRFGCVSCHDPHRSPTAAEKPAFYRAKCQTCHTPPAGRNCAEAADERAAVADNCVVCHMPRGASTSIVHAPVTDHRIRRRPTIVAIVGVPNGTLPLVPYRPKPGPDAERWLGLALAEAKLTGPEVRRQALDRLTTAVAARPADEPAWLALTRLHRGAERLNASRQATRFDPPTEASLAALANAATLADRPAEGITLGDRLVALSPTTVEYRVELAAAAVLAGDWPKAETSATAALAIYPLDAQARLFKGLALTKLGRGAEGSRELATALALHADPTARTAAERWLAGQLR